MVRFSCNLFSDLEPVNGNWGQWGEYSPCDRECGVGHQQRSRLCNDPPPANGGRSCAGDAYSRRRCNEHPCIREYAFYFDFTELYFSGRINRTFFSGRINGTLFSGRINGTLFFRSNQRKFIFRTNQRKFIFFRANKWKFIFKGK